MWVSDLDDAFDAIRGLIEKVMEEKEFVLAQLLAAKEQIEDLKKEPGNELVKKQLPVGSRFLYVRD